MKRRVSQKRATPSEDWGQILRTFSGHRISQEDMYRVMFQELPDVMTITEVCKILSISTKTGYKLITTGQLHALKVGRSYRVPKVYLFTYLYKDEQPTQKNEPKRGGKKQK